MQFSTILERFAEVDEQADGGYLALCPAHGDSRPSLRIWRGDDEKVRLTCRAGCETGAVIRAVDLKWSDMFNAKGDGLVVPRERPTLVGPDALEDLAAYVSATAEALPEHRAAADYLYGRFGLGAEDARALGIGVDDNPENLAGFRHRSDAFLRYPRITVPFRDFSERPAGLQGRDITGRCGLRWVSLSNPTGHHWATYGVFRGQGGYAPVLICEGPGDALTAVALGYDAVCIRGASLAGSPELVAELAAGLAGRQVILCGDTDTAGGGFNAKLADGLMAAGLAVFTLDIPYADSDLTEWRSKVGAARFPEALHGAVRGAQPVAGMAGLAVPDEDTGALVPDADEAARAVALVERLATRYGSSDVLNAHALVIFTGGRIKYAAGLGYYVWDGITWRKGETRVRQAVHYLGAALTVAASESGDEDTSKRLAKISKGFTLTRNIDSLMRELRAVPSVHIDVSEFDAQPHLLSFANGTVDLRTGTLRPHDKADLITYAVEVNYVPAALAPRWESFLSEIFPGHPELADYMRRLVGYGCTGSTDEQCFAVLWGKGANGKSVLTDVISTVFRPLVTTTGFSTFEEKANGGIPNDLAALRGARMVMASEGEAGKPMAESVIKRASGKDDMTARFLRQEFFTFKPTFLIMLATNHKPKFRGQDDGLWRRVKMIKFDRWFAPEERDYGLDKKLAAEAEGIAAWAVRGAIEWYANGLQDPEVITSATREYREASNSLAGFYPGIMEAAEAVTTPGDEAYNLYRDWCEAEGLQSREIWKRTTFYASMEERGAVRKKTAKGIALVGVRPAGVPKPAAAVADPGIFGE